MKRERWVIALVLGGASLAAAGCVQILGLKEPVDDGGGTPAVESGTHDQGGDTASSEDAFPDTVFSDAVMDGRIAVDAVDEASDGGVTANRDADSGSIPTDGDAATAPEGSPGPCGDGGCDAACDAPSCTAVCSPNATRCSATTPNAVETCQGGQWGAAQPCAFVCTQGACGGVCAPADKGCNGTTPRSCGPDGQWDSGTPCTNVCVSGVCAGSCMPGAQQCNVLTPQTCSDAGTWADGTPCTYVCTGGSCSGVCTPNDTQCVSGAQETCSASGQWANAIGCTYVCTGKTCGGVCTPGDTQCPNGSQQETCSGAGAWGTATNCPYVCAGKACGGVCSPNTTQCVSTTQEQTCASDGGWGGSTTCAYACVGTGVGGACGGLCVPTSMQCADNTHNQTCDNSGQWGLPAACPLATPPNPICANGNCAYHAGVDQAGASAQTMSASYVYAVSFSVSVITKVYRVGMFTTLAGRNVRMGIYSTSMNTPNTLLTGTAGFATANGAIEAPLAAAITLNPGTYWIAAVSDADFMSMALTAGGAGYMFANISTFALPGSVPASAWASGTDTPDFYVVLEAQ